MEPLLASRLDGCRGTPRSSTPTCARRGERHIVVTDTSRALARSVLFPPQWYVGWPAFRAAQLLTIRYAAAAIREPTGLNGRARRAGRSRRWCHCSNVAGLLPPIAREWPMARRRRPSKKSCFNAIDDVVRCRGAGLNPTMFAPSNHSDRRSASVCT